MKNAQFKISVPCSTSNLGPGFDSFGLAFHLRNDFVFTLGEAAPGGPSQPDDMTARAFLDAYRILTGERWTRDFRILSVSRIPSGSGLGSSATCAVAGAAAALYAAGVDPAPQAVFEHAARIEGHPDNAAAATFGGFTIAAPGDAPDAWRCGNWPVHRSFRFCAALPEWGVSTAKSRAALPEFVSRATAVYNLSHAALTGAALMSGDVALLRFACADKLHEPYRLPALRGASEAAAVLRDAGAAAVFLSGSGPALIGVFDVDPSGFLRRVQKGLAADGGSWSALPLEPEARGFILSKA